MELVIKLFSDKPSKIGVRYVYEFKATREYEDLIDKYRGETFRAKFEFVKDKIQLTLQSEISGGKIIYKDLEFKMDQVKKLQALFSPELTTHFVHVFPKANTLFVAKPYRQQEFLAITDVEFIAANI
jgi:hypothetical protein